MNRINAVQKGFADIWSCHLSGFFDKLAFWNRHSHDQLSLPIAICIGEVAIHSMHIHIGYK